MAAGWTLDEISDLVKYYPVMTREQLYGDGCIRKRSDGNKLLSLKIVGTEEVMVWTKEILNNIKFSKANVHKYSNCNISEYTRTGSMASKVLRKLYDVYPSSLDRKWGKVHAC